MQHAHPTQTRRAQARAIAVPASSSDAALLLPVVAGLFLLLLIL